MAKTTPKKKAAAKATKSSKLSLTVTIRLRDQAARDRLRAVAESHSISENALIQQLFDRYGDKLDLGPRVDSLESRVTALEGALRVAGALANSVLTQPADKEPVGSGYEDDDNEPDDEDEDEDDASAPDEDEDGPPSLLDRVR